MADDYLPLVDEKPGEAQPELGQKNFWEWVKEAGGITAKTYRWMLAQENLWLCLMK